MAPDSPGSPDGIRVKIWVATGIPVEHHAVCGRGGISNGCIKAASMIRLKKHMKKNPSPANRARKPVAAVQEKSPASQAAVSFPIIGIGASAGGFEALEQFMAHVPEKCGMAFVIVQHLDPTRKGLMPELLQRCTRMKVMQVKDRTRVRPDCVYVIPPNKNMSILHGVLHLFEPSAKRGQRLPIDFFLCSLALDQQQKAIGVILSGMGSDGTPGLRDIKEKGGLAVAQEPSSAKFDSMPRSVIDAGLADIVAPADELPGRIMAYLEHVPHAAVPEAAVESSMRGALEKILILMRSRTGHDFSYYKKNTLYRRIERRMGIHQIDKIASYVRFLNENPEELDLLFKELLIGVTGFFRDPDVWQLLREKTLPELLARHPTRLLRAWVAGCSTGEEAYTLAIVFREVVETLKPGKNFKLQIFATDLDRDAIDKARQGVFSEKISADLTPEQLRRYFTEEEGGYRVRAEIREMVIFSPHSVIKDPPFTKLDILSCRNLLIYLAPEMQTETLSAVSLQSESRRHPDPGERRNHRAFHRAVRHRQRQIPDLPTAGLRRAAGSHRVSILLRARLFRGIRCAGCAANPFRISRHRPSSCSSGVMRRPRCWSMKRETSSTSAERPANTWNPRRARRTSMSSRWPATACAMS